MEIEIVWDYLLKNVIFIKNSNDNEKNRCEEVKRQYALLMKQLPCRSNEIQYIEIMYHETVQEILTDRTIIEFPTFEIVPNHLLYLFPRRIKN